MPITELASTVLAVKQGVEDKATLATAEELAYLASATEKIGGAATLIDVVEAGEDAIKAIEQLVSNRTAELTAHGEATQAAMVKVGNDTQAAMVKVGNDTQAAMVKVGNDTQTAVTTHAGTTLDGLKTDAGAVRDASLKAITDKQAVLVTELAQLQTDADTVRDDALAAVADKRAVLARELDKIQPRPGARALFYNLI